MNLIVQYWKVGLYTARLNKVYILKSKNVTKSSDNIPCFGEQKPLL